MLIIRRTIYLVRSIPRPPPIIPIAPSWIDRYGFRFSLVTGTLATLLAGTVTDWPFVLAMAFLGTAGLTYYLLDTWPGRLIILGLFALGLLWAAHFINESQPRAAQTQHARSFDI